MASFSLTGERRRISLPARTCSLMTVQVEDSSPLLVYDPPGAWSDSSQDDPLLPVCRYVPLVHDSFSQSLSSSSSLTLDSLTTVPPPRVPPQRLSFTVRYHAFFPHTGLTLYTGIGITVLGGKRPQYGSFMVSVDGVLVVSDGSARGGSNVTRQILATVSGLPVGRHRAVIENAGGSPVDIDSVVIIDQVGSSGSATEMEGKIIEDSDPILSYAPSAAAWGQNQLEMFQGGTIR